MAQIPEYAWRTITVMHSRYAPDLPATEDGARTLTRMIIEQLVNDHPDDGWIWKSASPTRPPSKDCVARQTLIAFEGWDIFAGAGFTGPKILSTYPPTWNDLTGQTPIPVAGRNWLEDVPPPPPPPPPTDDLVERMTRVETRLGQLIASLHAV